MILDIQEMYSINIPITENVNEDVKVHLSEEILEVYSDEIKEAQIS